MIDRAPTPSDVQQRLERDRYRFVAGVVDPDEFAKELGAEYGRRLSGGDDCIVASISIFEIPGLHDRLGAGHVFDLVTDVTEVVLRHLVPTDVVNVSEDGEILVMARESRIGPAINRIDKIVSRRSPAAGSTVDGERAC